MKWEYFLTCLTGTITPAEGEVTELPQEQSEVFASVFSPFQSLDASYIFNLMGKLSLCLPRTRGVSAPCSLGNIFIPKKLFKI